MEDAFVEVMRLAVVAEVQPEHVEALDQQVRGGVAHVAGVEAALPAVQQQRGGARLAAGNVAVPALQARAVAAVAAVVHAQAGAVGRVGLMRGQN